MDRNPEKRLLLDSSAPPTRNQPVNGQGEQTDEHQKSCGETANRWIKPEASKQCVIQYAQIVDEYHTDDGSSDRCRNRDDDQQLDPRIRSSETLSICVHCA